MEANSRVDGLFPRVGEISNQPYKSLTMYWLSREGQENKRKNGSTEIMIKQSKAGMAMVSMVTIKYKFVVTNSR